MITISRGKGSLLSYLNSDEALTQSQLPVMLQLLLGEVQEVELQSDSMLMRRKRSLAENGQRIMSKLQNEETCINGQSAVAIKKQLIDSIKYNYENKLNLKMKLNLS